MNRGLLALTFVVITFIVSRVLDGLITNSSSRLSYIIIFSWLFLAGVLITVYSISLLIKRKRFQKKPWIWAALLACLFSMLYTSIGGYYLQQFVSNQIAIDKVKAKSGQILTPLNQIHNPKEAKDRKERSERTLKGYGIAINEHLPVTTNAQQVTSKNLRELANRAIALCICALKGEGLEQEFIEGLVNKYDAESYFSPNEKLFINDLNPSKEVRIQFAWRYECYYVLLWVLGYVDELPYPSQTCDAAIVVGILHERSLLQFLADVELRDLDSVLDQTDLVLRYHWAVTASRVKQKEVPSGLDGGVVKEWYYVLNWVIGYMQQDWDDVRTDM